MTPNQGNAICPEETCQREFLVPFGIEPADHSVGIWEGAYLLSDTVCPKCGYKFTDKDEEELMESIYDDYRKEQDALEEAYWESKMDELRDEEKLDA